MILTVVIQAVKGFIFIPLLILILRVITTLRKTKNSISFMHPNAASRGGGERVLWSMIYSLVTLPKTERPPLKIVIYVRSDDLISLEGLMSQTKNCFNIDIATALQTKTYHPVSLNLRSIKSCRFADPHNYKYVTIVMEALGSILATFEAILLFSPEFYIDTTGYGFSLLLPKLLGCKSLAYIHYPIIQSDMIASVTESKYNNAKHIARSKWLRGMKKYYYKILLAGYQYSIQSCKKIWANSTCTCNHIGKSKASILYPPCDTFIRDEKKENIVLSLGQFRPEKNQELIVESFSKANLNGYELVMIGGCRNIEDEMRLQKLRVLAENLKIVDKVKFLPNLPYPDLKNYLKKSKIGIHAMENEHFGIVLVEFQANSVIPIAHNSAGPKFDIIEHSKTGFLANDQGDFVEFLQQAACLSESDVTSIKSRMHKSCQRFSEESFNQNFRTEIQNIMYVN